MTTLKQWRLTEAQKQAAVAMYEAGSSIGKIAAIYSVSRQSMWDVLRRRTKMRDRLAALPRKDPNYIRLKRLAALRRYRSRAARIKRWQVQAVKDRDKICRMCGGTGTDIDHIRPVSKGGQTELTNLQLLCRTCHHEKSRRDRKGVYMEVSQASGQLTLFAEASRSLAKICPTPEKARASPVNGRDYGASTPVLLARFDPATFSWRTSQRCLVEGLATFSGTWPRSGLMRSGIAYRLPPLAEPSDEIGPGLLPLPHDQVARRYFIAMPSMLRAIGRGYMVEMSSRPTLTTKVVDRAPCPYWPTSFGPRYLTESEAERATGLPVGWTDTGLAATPSSRKSRNSSDAQSPKRKE